MDPIETILARIRLVSGDGNGKRHLSIPSTGELAGQVVDTARTDGAGVDRTLTYRKYASCAIFGRRLAAGPFSPL